MKAGEKDYSVIEARYRDIQRRARRLGCLDLSATFPPIGEWWETLLDLQRGICLFPRCPATDLVIDHVIPLSKFGAHSPDNIQLLCNHHNSVKYDRHGPKWDFRPEWYKEYWRDLTERNKRFIVHTPAKIDYGSLLGGTT